MKNVTDPEENRGKQLAGQTFLLEFSYAELTTLQAVAKNPHPDLFIVPCTRADIQFLSHDVDWILWKAGEWHRKNNLEDGS